MEKGREIENYVRQARVDQFAKRLSEEASTGRFGRQKRIGDYLRSALKATNRAKMAEEIVISVKRVTDAVPAVIARWGELTATGIAEIAEQIYGRVYTASEREIERIALASEGQPDLLYSLALCKSIDFCNKSIEELVALWQRIECNDDGRGYGGLIEGAKNYRTARKFIEGLFVPVLLRALEEEFDLLARRASGVATQAARIQAFEDADEKLQDIANGFDFLPNWNKKVEKLRERQSDLLQQLIEAEEAS